MNWCDYYVLKFHLLCDKAPMFLAYLNMGQNFPETFDNLKLGNTRISRIDEVKSLGLTRRVRPIDSTDLGKSHGRLIDKYGYECIWDETRLKQLAYRFQRVKFSISPEFMKKMVMAYFCGIVRFSSSIIFERAPKAHINLVRFYYCVAMSAALGLTAAEALNLGCCKRMSVNESNSGYKKLLSETGLPSLREMACQDAVSNTKQIFGMIPKWYTKTRSSCRTRSVAADESDFQGISGVSTECKGTLVDILFQNSK